ncbi:MAG: ABC transporter permease [Gemmatimonadaceae bacterium]
MDQLRQDIRFALRGFRRTPGFFITAVVILALGIGMSVAMFTVFRTVLIRKLPVIDQDRIAVMWTYRDDPNVETAPGMQALAAFKRDGHTIKDVAGVAHWPATQAAMLDGERSLAMNRGMATGNFFDVLGVRPALGRLFRPEDDDNSPTFDPAAKGASLVIVLSYAAWQSHFGGDSSVIGRHLIEPLLRWDYRIIGVAPPGFSYPSGVEYWIPMWQGWYSGVSSIAVARLAPGATLSAARDEYLTIERRAVTDFTIRGVHAATFTDTVLGNVQPVLATLTAAVALLLLIACLNVGNLLLLRASGRAREISVRRALGAAYGDIVRQLFVEAMTLAVVGGALGFVVAIGLLDALAAFAPQNLPRLDDVRLSGAPVLAAIGISSAAVLLFGMLPALFAARSNLASPLRLDSRSGNETRRRRTLRQTLVASQIALAMIMLSGAALLARSLARLERQDLGYTSEHLAILSFSWNAKQFDSTTKMLRLSDRVLANLQKINGVTSATPIVIPPLLGLSVWQGRFDAEGQSPAQVQGNPMTPIETAGPDFFKTFGILLDRGRSFSRDDQPAGPYEVIVSESVARRLWPGQDPIGKRLRDSVPADFLPGGGQWRTVVGVAKDTHLRTIRQSAPTIYLPWMQGYWQGSFAIRTSVDVTALTPAIRAAGIAADPGTVLWRVRTMDQLLDEPLAQPRLSAMLMMSFGLVALLLASIGLYGVMAALVRDQMREIGIRIALGATPSHVRRDVLGRAAIVTGAGLAVGVAAALATSRLFQTLLFDVSPVDPIALGGACLLLLAVGALAAYVPARRATRIDPVQALRAD